MKRSTIALAILALGGSLAYWGWHRSQPAPTPPDLTETKKEVVVRLYANLRPYDSYLLISDDAQVCYVDEAAWLTTVVGQPATCLWKPVNPRRAAPAAAVHLIL